MDRLTKVENGLFNAKRVDTNEYGIYELLQPVLDKLAAYEDTGLMPDDVEELKGKVAHLQSFYRYMTELYGEGLEVANWHQNGDLEPFDNFFDSADSVDNEDFK